MRWAIILPDAILYVAIMLWVRPSQVAPADWDVDFITPRRCGSPFTPPAW